MKLFSTLFISIAGVSAFAQPVHLNPIFGNNGIAITPNTTEINRIATDAGGTIFSAGYSMEPGSSGIYHLTVTKHSHNGILLSNFGTNGMVKTTIDYSEFPLDIRLQNDGKILVAGSSYLGPTPSGPGDYNSFVVRYTTTGSLDNTFGNNGIFKLSHPNSHIAKMIVPGNGSVLLAGNSYGTGVVSKINSSGVLDPNFGNSGSKFLSDANFTFILWDAILLSDNTILCVGYDITDQNNMKVAYCKLDLNGNFVTSFGTNGKVIADLYPFSGSPEVDEFLQKAVELPNGQIVMGGQAMGAILAKINPDGTFDTGFGTNGVVTHSYPYVDFAVQPDGKFLIGGTQEVSLYNAGFSITRLNSNGSTDNSFNGTGTFTVDVSPDHDYLQTIELKTNGHIIVGGSSRYSNNEANFMLADIDISQSLGLSEENSSGIVLYPNPFSDKLTLSIENESVTSVRLVDAAGRFIEAYPVNKLTVLSLNSLASGAYQLIFTDNNGKEIHVQKLIKE
ncbi:T9SS type A sorting domain-containing protein [Fluviicola sp.]|uniref:T9SS type A sorting domain-containing protein n=1 Tax=Fluviicola sp. TaxID=1917219 RepID=UPI0031DC3E15